MTINVAYSVTKISGHVSCKVTVTGSELIYAYECRATPVGSTHGRGIGIDLIADDVLNVLSNGVYTFIIGRRSFTFDVQQPELITDGTYRISVFCKPKKNVWYGDL